MPNLETVVLPDSMAYVLRICFAGCPLLHTVTVSDDTLKNLWLEFDAFDNDPALFDDGEFQILNDIFLYKYTGNAETLTVPDGIQTIGMSVFQQNSRLTSIALPESLTHVHSYAFSNCTGLRQIDLPSNLAVIRRSAFSNCTSLREITIPDSVNELDDSLFSGCDALRHVTLPAQCTKLTDAYDSRILIWDPNYPTSLCEESCLYFDSTTFDYCIPQYSVKYSSSNTAGNKGGISSFCNDVDVRNAVLLARVIAEDKTAAITDQGKINAELDGVDGLTAADLDILLRMLAGIE